MPSTRLHVIYRATGGDNRKNRPPMYSKMRCLLSLLRAYDRVRDVSTLTFLNDGPMPDDRRQIEQAWGEIVDLPGLGNSPSYRVALERAILLPESSIVYFAEDDYLYTEAAFEALLSAFDEIPAADYVTLYDHVDRYKRTDDSRGGLSRVFIGGGRHWRTVESTCMTFGARVSRLKQDAWIQRFATRSRTPKDRILWRLTQGQKWFFWKFPKRSLLGAMPALATHMERDMLAPNVDWAQVARDVDAFESLGRAELHA